MGRVAIDGTGRALDSAIGQAFRATRAQHGVTVRQASGHLDVPEQHLASIEDGTIAERVRPPVAAAYLRIYARFLGYDAERILAGDPPGTPDEAAPVSAVRGPTDRPVVSSPPVAPASRPLRVRPDARSTAERPFAEPPVAAAPNARRRRGPVALLVIVLAVGAGLATAFFLVPPSSMVRLGSDDPRVIPVAPATSPPPASEDDAESTGRAATDGRTWASPPPITPTATPPHPVTATPTAPATETASSAPGPIATPGPEVTPTGVTDDVAVQVLDGRGEGGDGAYAGMIGRLEELGYTVVDGGPTVQAFPMTRLLFNDGHQGAAEELTRLERGLAAPAEPNSLGLTEDVQLHVIVGDDWSWDEADAPPPSPGPGG